MNLSEIRTKILEISGMNFLNSGSPKAIDTYISWGVDYLDRKLFEIAGMRRRIVYNLSANNMFINLSGVKFINNVYIYLDKETKVRLIHRTLEASEKNIDLITDSNYPTFWSFTPNTTSSEFYGVDISTLFGNELTTTDKSLLSKRSIFLYPKTTTNISVHIDAVVFSEKLVSDTDTNIWSLNNSDILVKAVLRTIHSFYGRMTEAARLDEDIDQNLRVMDFVIASEDVSNSVEHLYSQEWTKII